MHSDLAKLRREMDALRAQLQAATDRPCMVIRIRRVTESGEIATVESGNTAGPGHTCSDNCRALIIGLAEDPEAPDFRERLAQRVAREVKAHSGSGAEARVSLERTRRTCAFYGVPFPEVAERPCADASGGSATSTEGAGARSDRGRGDAQPSPERASAESTPEPVAPRSPAPAAEPQAALVAVPALVSPLALEMRQEAMARARELSEEVRLLVPWWLPVAPSQLAACAIPWCHHEAAEHRAVRTRLPCRRCGFQADQHRSDGLALAVPLYARKVSPCDNYNAICVDQDDHDGCEHPGCTCRAYCRWVPPDPSDPRTALDVRTVEMARALAETREELARLQEAREAEQRDALRAQGANPLGPSPHSAPVFVEGESA